MTLDTSMNKHTFKFYYNIDLTVYLKLLHRCLGS